jgi:hypothetical protein
MVELELLGLASLFEEPAEHSEDEVEYDIFIEDLFYFVEFCRSSFEK